MNFIKQEHHVYTGHLVEKLNQKMYLTLKSIVRSFFVGNHGLGYFLKFELISTLLGPMPGGLGLLLRKWFHQRLFKTVGSAVLLHKLSLGRNTRIA